MCSNNLSTGQHRCHSQTRDQPCTPACKKVLNHYLHPYSIPRKTTSQVIPLFYVRRPKLAVVPAALVFGNLIEWLVHKELLHRLRPGFFVFYSRHALNHHQFFNSERMTFDGPDDLRIVFFPPFAILASIGGTAAIGAGLARLSGSRNAGLLYNATSTAFYLLYEAMHLCEHVPETSFAARIPFVAFMRRHHAHHHDKRVMVERNMNLTFPLADALLGTLDRAASQS